MDEVTQYFWAASRCGRVRFLAAPFGYGPRVAAETLADLLEVHIEGWESSVELPASSTEQLKLLLNFGLVDVDARCARSTCKVWIDCIMWLRRSLPKMISGYDMILAEAFFNTRESFLSLPGLEQISPLLTASRTASSRERPPAGEYILVSFGGVETPFTRDVHRWPLPTLVLESLQRSMKDSHDPRKLVCCVPRHLSHELQGAFNLSQISFLSPTHEVFLKLLRGASLYVVQTGLYGPFEAFELQIPTVFCTPFSYTQICQARKYQENGLLGPVPLWADLDEEIGPLHGDIETEEPLCFTRIAQWLEKNLDQNGCRKEFRQWADLVVGSAPVSPDLTAKRSQYGQSRKEFADQYVDVLSRLLCTV
jgi:hypothetical protein